MLSLILFSILLLFKKKYNCVFKLLNLLLIIIQISLVDRNKIIIKILVKSNKILLILSQFSVICIMQKNNLFLKGLIGLTILILREMHISDLLIFNFSQGIFFIFFAKYFFSHSLHFLSLLFFRLA